MNKSLAIVVLTAAVAAVACHGYFSYRPVERQVLEHLGLEEMPLGRTAGEWAGLFGEPGYISFGMIDRNIAGKPAENPYKELFDVLVWQEKGCIIAISQRKPGDVDVKFRNAHKFRVVKAVIPARWEFELLTPDGATQKIKALNLIPVKVGGKSLREFKPADFRKMYFFMREEKPGLYTMGKYPFSSDFTAYFSNGELQFFQMNRDFGLFEVL